MADTKGSSSTPAPPVGVVIDTAAQAPVPVVVALQPELEPVPAHVLTPQQVEASPTLVTASEGTVLAPTTTEHENVVTAVELKDSRIMQYSQAVIAMAITVAVTYTAINGLNNETLANAFFVVIGFYFANGFGRSTKRL